MDALWNSPCKKRATLQQGIGPIESYSRTIAIDANICIFIKNTIIMYVTIWYCTQYRYRKWWGWSIVKKKKKNSIFTTNDTFLYRNKFHKYRFVNNLDRSIEGEDAESTKSRAIFAIYPEASVVESIEQKQKLWFVVYQWIIEFYSWSVVKYEERTGARSQLRGKRNLQLDPSLNPGQCRLIYVPRCLQLYGPTYLRP